MAGMYRGDSFFTLSAQGQLGLAVLSAVFGISIVLLTRRLSAGRRPVWRLAVWATLFFLFIWLSPQAYYAYYRMILSGLPAQSVIRWPDPAEPLALLSFTARGSLSDHARGLLGWAMLAAAMWPGRKMARQPGGNCS